MPEEFDFKNYKSIEEFSKTVEGSKYFHGLYLKAVNHPIRREILIAINDKQRIARKELLDQLIERNIVNDEASLDYNIDYLIKAFCLNKTEENNSIFYEITQGGKVIEYL